ncbi:MAG: hypothetical protein Q9210_000562 [Variospora velana]
MLVYAIDALCEHTEYIKPLREEMQQHLGKGESDMPLLDSFLKEAARLYPSDSIAVRRKALIPFTFSGGIKVKKDEVACVPLRAIMRDPQNYAGGPAFDGFRFVNSDGTKKNSRFADGDAKFPMWGLGRRICGGPRDIALRRHVGATTAQHSANLSLALRNYSSIDQDTVVQEALMNPFACLVKIGAV